MGKGWADYDNFIVRSQKGEFIYLHQRGAFSVARFDNPGNAKALTSGTSARTGSTLFVYTATEK